MGTEALLDTDTLLLRWFDHWLKDANTFAHEPHVRHFALGINRWMEAGDARGSRDYTLFLSSNGRAESRKGNGRLSTLESSGDPDVLVYDPEVPVFAPGGPMAMSGPFDQSAMEQSNNVLVYTGDPLIEPLHVFGRVAVDVFVQTTRSFADVVAKLVRVLPSGRAEFISIGIARASYLFGNKSTADAPQRWQFTLEPTSCVFAAGECLRLEIAGCAFPLYDRNPSNATAPRNMTPFNWQRATHLVWHDLKHPSRVVVPILHTEEVS
jgi:putative CocE/NonD family hydrolase